MTRSHTFLFGFEESYGFLSSTFVRDKDGVNASLLIAEAAAYCTAPRARPCATVMQEIFQHATATIWSMWNPPPCRASTV